jgi:hypothetical protein
MRLCVVVERKLDLKDVGFRLQTKEIDFSRQNYKKEMFLGKKDD